MGPGIAGYQLAVRSHFSFDMTLEETFNFSLLRISILQILKAHGFDKSKPSTLNVATDLYLKMLNLIIVKAKKYSQQRNSDDIDTIDILLALTDIGIVKPENRYNTRDVSSWLDWLNSTNYQCVKSLNKLPKALEKTILENRSFKNDQQDDEAKLRKKQDFYNNLINDRDNEGNDDDEEDLNISWLTYLIEKDNKFSNKRFEQTSLYVKDENDTQEGETVVSPYNEVNENYILEESTDELNRLLPINLQYNQVLYE